MNTISNTRRTIVRHSNENTFTVVNGQKAVDVTDLPDMRCILCSWSGGAHELSPENDDPINPDYRCPECNKSEGLTDISYNLDANDNLVEEQQTLERAFDVRATQGTLYSGNLFVELKSQGIPCIEGAVVVDFTGAELGEFRIKKSGEMQFSPPEDFIGVVPVRIVIQFGDTVQHFIANFHVRKNISVLGED